MIGKYIKIYFWQFISILLNFGTLFVVTPYLSSNQALFGIYTIVISLNIFLSYADFGFISAGLKYASEFYVQGKKAEEIRTIGFVGFVFAVFVGLFMLIMLGFSVMPQALLNELHKPDEIRTAKYLLIMLALFAPTFVLQRVLQLIFAVRLEDYHFQRLLIISNLLKITSTFYFFGFKHYLLIEYFLFTQVCNLLAMIVGVLLVRKKLNYDISLLARSFRYSKFYYKKTKKLAFSSILLTVCWILYYQLDPFVIGKLAGVKLVAIYAIGLTITTYLRSLFGIIFSPFIARFNHYIGLKNEEGLKRIFSHVLIVTLPITVFPSLCIFLTTKALILNWVGPDYITSVTITQFLVLCFIFNFITSPAGILIMAYEKVKLIYITSALLPIIFWLGIAATYTFLGLFAFSLFKFLSFFVVAVIYLVISCRVLNLKLAPFAKKVLLPAVLPICIMIVITQMIKAYIPVGHNKINLLYYTIINGLICLIGIIAYFLSSPVFKEYVMMIVNRLKVKFSTSTQV
ncbi:Membrane protein involved in the export of O-antigen and teichoic acid [Chitinophaga rupis]|uniref:Membrane protein involved in the export of O-antigen and teichoic acid n=1 Tax=Chitinophaga rupis TaxID=573321 RepID=A0A1H7LNY3_9BACT|nr:lipopolysaccharide biosynthesis protein [Chitinophaga rupis]SEL00641.1 Membrane protein involved in the export of O-antigen and teichoic acid [Chitinophaga rupis]